MPKLMIVDDERPILESLRFALEDDFEVVTAQSGEECLRLIPKHTPDLVMTDYKMSGIDGLQLLKALSESASRPALVMYSAYMTPELTRQAHDLGAAVCLSKPMDLSDLKQSLNDALA